MINGLDGLIYEERLKGLIICIFVKEQLRRVQQLLTRGSRTVNTLTAFHRDPLRRAGGDQKTKFYARHQEDIRNKH